MRGIQNTPHGFRAFVRVKGHAPKSKRFPKDADLNAIQLWRERERAKLVLRKQGPTSAHAEGPFRANALIYLEAVKGLESYADRVRHIFEWIALFENQECDTIEAVQIRAQRDRWLTVGPRSRQRGKLRVIEAKPLAANTVNIRLRALRNMWTVLWPNLPNPVKAVPEVEQPDTLPRDIRAEHIDAAFAKLPPGKTRARLHVLRWTGFPRKTLVRLKPEDVDLEAGIVYLAGRKKGAGTKGTALPLLPQAIAAFKLLHREDAWGHFSKASMYAMLLRACKAAKVPKFTPYQLRHTFGTNFLHATKDLRATQRALMLSTPRMAERYARAAVDPVMAAAYAVLAKAHNGAKVRHARSTKRTTQRKR